MKKDKKCFFHNICHNKKPRAWKRGKNICRYCFNQSKLIYTKQFKYFQGLK
jgi:hypothetical protein